MFAPTTHHLCQLSALIFEKICDDHQNDIPRLRKVLEHAIIFLRKEVIHRQLPLPMPCYDLAPVTSIGLDPK